MFILGDSIHCEQERFATFELALAKIRQLAELPWHAPPNRAPCTSWRTCGRQYCISEQEYNETTQTWTFGKLTPIVEIDAKGVRWEPEWEPRE